MMRAREIRRLGHAGAALLFALSGPGGAHAASLKTLYSFTPSIGSTPMGTLTIAPLGAGVPYGTLFGVASSGGVANRGSVFAIQPPSAPGTGWTANVIHAFAGEFDGANPTSSPRLESNGTISGATTGGEAWWSGMIYGLTPQKPAPVEWAYISPFERRVTQGSGLHGYDLCLKTYDKLAARSPNVFPVAQNLKYCYPLKAKSAGDRRRFGLSPSSSTSVDTGAPGGTPADDGAGGLYVAFLASTPPGGAVADLTPPSTKGQPWNETILYLFGQSPGDLSGPNGQPILDATGALYGVARTGGAHNVGGIYRLNPPGAGQSAWTEDILWSFGGAGDGQIPNGELARDPSFALYGTAVAGGAYGWGIAYRLAPPPSGQTGWGETVLHSFQLNRLVGDGAQPQAGLHLDAADDLFGTTSQGGANFDGTVFELSPPAPGATSWSEKILWSFTGGIDGAIPLAGLVADGNGNLYGTASAGGTAGTAGPYANRGYGTVFKLKP